jgi:hypothetical protein
MSRRLTDLALLAPLLVLLALPARAELTATLGGQVTGPEGAPLDRALVIVRGHGLPPAGRRVTSDARGNFRLIGLSPGRYDVIARYPRLVSAVAREVVARAGRRTELRLQLARKGDPEPPRDLRARSVDLTDPGRVQTLDRSFLERLPTDRTITGEAQLLPGVIGEAGAGLEYARAGTGQLRLHGQGLSRARYRLDGVTLNDPHTGLLTSVPPIDALGELRVQTAGLDAEHGFTTAGIVDVTSRPATDRFVLDAAVFSLPSSLRLIDDADAALHDHTAFQLRSAGPIRRGRLWYSLSFQYLDETSVRVDAVPVFEDVPLIVPETTRAMRVLGQLTWRPAPWQRLSLALLGDPTWGTNTRQDPRVHPQAERQTFDGGVTLGITSRTQLSHDVLLEGRLGYTGDRAQVFPASGDIGLPGLVRDTGEARINDTVNTDDFHQRLETAASLTLAFDLAGEHELKGGAEADVRWTDLFRSLPGGAILREEEQGENLVIVGRDRELAPVDRQLWANTTALFLQDTWRPWTTFTVRAGIRYEGSRALLDPRDGGAPVYDLNWASPRVGVAWDPFGDGRTAIRAGYYQYADLGRLQYAEAATPGIKSVREDVEGGAFVAGETAQRAGAEIEPSRAPILHEVVLGFERELDFASILGAHLIHRRKDGLFEDREVNVLWDADGASPVGFADGDPRTRFVLGTPLEAYSEYTALELSLERPLSGGWGLLASYTLADLRGTAEDDLGPALDNNRNLVHADGLLPGDVTHRALLSLAYELPLGFQVAGTARYESGRPYARRFPSLLPSGRVEAPLGVDPTDGSALRTDELFLASARVAWSLLPLTDQDVTLNLDIINALGSRAALVVDERDGSTFGDVIERAPPTTVRLGLRYRF